MSLVKVGKKIEKDVKRNRGYGNPKAIFKR